MNKEMPNFVTTLPDEKLQNLFVVFLQFYFGVDNKEMKNAEAEIIPTTQHILDSYPRLSVLEKNSLWKIVMEKITIDLFGNLVNGKEI